MTRRSLASNASQVAAIPPAKPSILSEITRNKRVIFSPIVGTALIGLTILVSMFVLAYAWEFWLEAGTMHLFGLPYDDADETRDNWRYIIMSLAFVSLSLVAPLVLVGRYSSRIHRTISRLELARQEAETANIAKSRFLANMSHELRTPLNAIIGFSDLTMNSTLGPIDERYRSYAEDIHRSGKHLLTILNDVLDLSKSEVAELKIELRDVSVDAMVYDLGRMIAPLIADAHLTYTVTMDDGLPLIRADEVRFKQVLLNVASNAIKFTNAGGRISIEAARAGDWVLIKLADTGIGIAPENLLKVMEPFYQVDSSLSRKREGTGLGLPITKRLVELMGGTFALTSQFGVGTRATIRIPAGSPAKAKIAA
jgi:signal transduction histidine kinase